MALFVTNKPIYVPIMLGMAKIGVVAFNKAVRDLVPTEKLDVFFEVANTINEIIDKKSIYDKVNVNQLGIKN